MGNVPDVLGNLSNFGQTALPLQRHSMTSMLGLLAMVKPPVMLVGSLFLNMVMVFGCASGFVDPASTFPAGLS